MSDIYINIEDIMRRMAGLGYEDRGRLICDALGSSSQMTIEQLQDLARCGKMRMRIFGEESFYGIGLPFSGNLDRAADGLPHAFNTGMVALYYDANGLFIGPSNPALIDQDPLSRSADEIGDDLP